MNVKIEKSLAAAREKMRKQQAMVAEYQNGIRELALQSPDMVLSAMPMKLQNLQDAVCYLEMLKHETKVLESLLEE